ncbi:MAG: putative outer rane efflux protein MdtP [Planctomycetota bacterium]|nr:putative outer rane efflux protein MdtP [Planctomycetota bacterium]
MMPRACPTLMGGAILLGVIGCTQTDRRTTAKIDDGVRQAAYHEPSDPAQAMAFPTLERGDLQSLAGPQPVDTFLGRALAENRTVQAAYHNVQSLRHRLPQVTALDDPVLSNTIFPIPAVAPQYSLMGYNPYNVTLAQQFPWVGTLRLRGEVAERDVQVALAELAAAQLDTVAAVKRAYYSLYASERADEILAENRAILDDFREIARQRLATGGSQQDVLRAETLISELDRNRAENQAGAASARAALARQLHVSPGTDFHTLPDLSFAAVPAEFDRLQQLAIAARPELQGRLAAVARDEKAVELARKRAYPNLTLGLSYMQMEKTNATTPATASGVPNVGLFVAFNLPVNQMKYRAAVCEAQERTLADARLYEAQRDETGSEIQELMVQAKVQQDVLSLLRDSLRPRARQSLDNARSDYAKGNVDYATVQSALRETLQVQLQIVQVEAELGKALAALERAVGCEINARPPAREAIPPPPQPPAASGGPFQPPAQRSLPDQNSEDPEPIPPV